MISPSRPEFSVVIASYNSRHYLLDAVRSVVEQSYPALEIIVVDDGSTDVSADAVRKLYPAVVVIEQTNSGKCLARNAGIARATGNWICFLDHDDLWHRDKLQSAAQYIEKHSECSALNHPMWFFGSKESADSCFGFTRDFIADNLDECHEAVVVVQASRNDISYMNICGNSFALMLERNCGALSASMVKRDVLISAGCFSPMQTNGEDWTMFVNVARICEWHTMSQRLGFYRLHSRQDSNTMSDGGIVMLAGITAAWYSGRPLKQATAGTDFLRELEKYGRTYRFTIQQFLWRAVRAGRWRTAVQVHTFGLLLLPRLLDFLYIHIPPAITWRIERAFYRSGRKQSKDERNLNQANRSLSQWDPIITYNHPPSH